MIFNVFKCSRRTFSKANTRFKYVNQQKNNTQLVVEPPPLKKTCLGASQTEMEMNTQHTVSKVNMCDIA